MRAVPILFVFWRKLPSQAVLDAQLSLLVISTQHEGGWDPVWQLQGERVAPLARGRRTIDEVSQWENQINDRERAPVVLVVSTLALLVPLVEVNAFRAIQADSQVVTVETRLLQIDVDYSLHDLAGYEGDVVVQELNEDLATLENVCLLASSFDSHAATLFLCKLRYYL